MSAYERVLRPILFRLDAERAHNLALWAVARGLIRTRLVKDDRLQVSANNLYFSNPVGLAAGVDKDATAVSRWSSLGFGFAEVGTLTYHGQPGNPKPRLIRIPEDKAIINRMGFNNGGISAAAPRLASRGAGIPIGVNIGKSKVTPIEDAAAEYAKIYEIAWKLGDYVVVNVSSPNTPDLRSLQDKQALSDILTAMRTVKEGERIFVKISPDLTVGQLEDVVEVGWQQRIAGFIATNTTVSRDGLSRPTQEVGGLSGRPLKPLADDNLQLLSEMVNGEMTLIGVGGIFSAQDVLDKLRLGASLVQIYSGWVYNGPGFVPKLLLGLLDAMNEANALNLSELTSKGVAPTG
ncbi:MAG: Dihydroorotate dehydrogenase (quinone) [Fimbriimonadaceae bacterium]|nr:Dihydroorotate dehydrogenase (quinone) [Fimbriimonadaceae bacterium]